MEETNWCDFRNLWICISTDKKTGEIKERKHLRKNGDLWSRTLYHNKITEFKMWDRAGILRKHEFYNPSPHGRFREWYSNGQLAIDEFRENGKINGERKTWRFHGHRRLYEFWENGKCIDPLFTMNKKYRTESLKRKFQRKNIVPINTFLISDLSRLSISHF